MKKLSLICMTILSVAFFASCRGPQGPQGPAGNDGNANVASSTVTVRYNDWQWVNDCQWMVEIDYPAINNNVYNHGAVLVYMKIDDVWSQVPMTYFYEAQLDDGTYANFASAIEVGTLNDGGVRLFWTESDFYHAPEGPGKYDSYDFKIVAIEASVFANRTDVDYNSYEAVKTAFQLAD